MTILKWLILAILSGLLGFSTCAFLTVHPLKMSRFAFASAVALCALAATLATLFRRTELAIAIPVALALTLAWMKFKDPKPQVKVEEFAQNGAEKVLYFAAAISADAIHSQREK